MFRMLVLQQLHGLSDFELEKQSIDRIYLGKFLGFPAVENYETFTGHNFQELWPHAKMIDLF